MEYLKQEQVVVTDPYFQNALELDVDNLLVLEADRLLAGFRETACYAKGMTDRDEITAYMKNCERYGGGWENSLIGGHIMGHYLTAVAQGVVNLALSKKDRDALQERMDYLVDELAACQNMTMGTAFEGYLFGATLPTEDFHKKVDLQFDNVEHRLTNIGDQAWVPWYTMHKIVAGLLDCYVLAGNEKALATAKRLGDWIANRANSWNEALQRVVLDTEYGGMNDVMYELYKVTGKESYREAAHQFDEVDLFEAVLSGADNVLNAKHANTTIPKFLGALCRYEVDSSEKRYFEYATSFFDMVLQRHTYVTGGNSEDEHFGADNVLNLERTNCNNETCNTYNMLKLSRRLFRITGEKKYADYYEKTLINAILSSQDHKTGRTMYFQPMATGYQKIFGTVDSNFWCCTGSGMENFTKLQDSIYFQTEEFLIINQFISSEVTTDAIALSQEGRLTKEDDIRLTIRHTDGKKGLMIRVPEWAKDATIEDANGDVQNVDKESGYWKIPASMVTEGAVFVLSFPMHVAAYNLPDGANTYAFQYGPYVLSARLGTSEQKIGYHGVTVMVPVKKAVKNDTIGILSVDSVEEFMAHIEDNLVKKTDEMVFMLDGTTCGYEFTPHYDQDEESYGIYWTYYVDKNGRDAQAILEEKRAERMERHTIDAIEQIGRGQYEQRFLLTDGLTKDGLVDQESVGADAPALTRYAKANGYFGYKMEAICDQDALLLVTLLQEERDQELDVYVGDEKLTVEKETDLTLAEADKEAYYQVLYRIPAAAMSREKETLTVVEGGETVEKQIFTVKFTAHEKESRKICRSLILMTEFSTENSLAQVKVNGALVIPENDCYDVMVPYDTEPQFTFDLADDGGYLEVKGNAVDTSKKIEISTTGVVTEETVVVYSEDFESKKTYTLKITRDYSSLSLQKEALPYTAVAVTKPDLEEKDGQALNRVTGHDGKENGIGLNGEYGLRLLEDASVLGRSYSISFWMKPDEVGNPYDPTIAGGNFAADLWLNLPKDSKIWSYDHGFVSTESTNAYQASKWQNVVVTVDGSIAGSGPNTVLGHLYVDGECVSHGNVVDGIMTTEQAKLYFGINPWDQLFLGTVSGIQIFPRTLSEKEVQAIAAKLDI